jgi:DNA-binding GntR family transcriptional regulator
LVVSDMFERGPRTGRIQKPTLAAVIARVVRDEILSGQIPPGAQLNEVELATRFATSRGPIREGLQRLVQEGIVVSAPHRGLFVPVLTLADLEDIYFARAALERAAILRLVDRGVPAAGIAELEHALAHMQAALEAEDLAGLANADLRFHEVIVARAASERLGRLYTMLTSQTRLGLNLLLGTYEHRSDLVAEHQAILHCLIARDRRAALEKLEDHFRDAGEALGGFDDLPRR